MAKELITWETVKETGSTLTSVAGMVKGVGELVSSHKEKKLNSELKKIETKAFIKVAEDKAKYVRTMHQMHNVDSVYAQVENITNPRSRKKCEKLADKLADGYYCDD